jgi:signal transduction histidine kinase
LEAIHPDDQRLAQDELRLAEELGEHHDFVLRVRGKLGMWRYMRIDAQARYDIDGKLNHLRCHLKDVTDRVHAEQELRRRTELLTAANEQLRLANRSLEEAQAQLVHSEKLAAVGTLAAGMAHEINNPLAIASNNVAVLGRDVGALIDVVTAYHDAIPVTQDVAGRGVDEADLRYLRDTLPRLVDATARALLRVGKIVQDLREFAQIDRGELVEVDINRSLEQALGLLGALLATHHITVDRDFGPLPPQEAKAAHLNQALFNVLHNAAQAIEATGRGGGRIRLWTQVSGDDALVEVSDDGCGIAADALPRVFDPFFTTKPVGRGTGLRLSLARQIVADHGGTVEIESTPGTGTKVRLRLPAGRPAHSGTVGGTGP